MARSKLDATQIAQTVFDADEEAYRSTIVGGEMEIELDHSDGDSVLALPLMTVPVDPVALNDTFNTTTAKRVCFVSEDNTMTVVIIGVVNGVEFTIDTLNFAEIKEICVPELKIGTITSSDPVYIVLQS